MIDRISIILYRYTALLWTRKNNIYLIVLTPYPFGERIKLKHLDI